MKENKLSREEKWLHKWCGECSFNHDCHDCKDASECAETFVKIKSLLTPIPEKKIDEFVERWGRFWNDNFYSAISHDHTTNHVEEMLKEYDKLKEGNEYISVLPGVGAIKVTK